jgi:hypothetical protein
MPFDKPSSRRRYLGVLGVVARIDVLLGSIRVLRLWTIRPDGSGLAALTKDAGIPGFPVWSPDGAVMALPQPEMVVSPTEIFGPTSWSAGGRIAGQIFGFDGATAVLGNYDRATRQFTRVAGDGARRTYWCWPVWLNDGRRLIVRRPDGIAS